MRGEDCDDSKGACEAGIEVGAGTCVGRILLETVVRVERRNRKLKPRMNSPAYFKSRYGDALRREYREQGDSLSMDHSLDAELRLLSLMMSAVLHSYNGERSASYGMGLSEYSDEELWRTHERKC
jgi:hypothetical protein